jgi:hypothetical protein
MSFRLASEGLGLPYSFPVDPSSNFLPGMLGQLVVIGNQVMCGVSDGTSPIGIIDDIKTRSFTAVAWNEIRVAQAVGVPGPNSQLITPVDVVVNLSHAYVQPASFVSTVDVALNPVNGTITFPVGTPLNYDLLGTGVPNALQTVVNYSYQIPNIPGDDSTAGNQRVTIWYQRLIGETDQFETNATYPVSANLYSSPFGLLTTRRYAPNLPAIAIVMAPPMAIYQGSSLMFMWL